MNQYADARLGSVTEQGRGTSQSESVGNKNPFAGSAEA
jgi:hypothetical protein